MCSASFFSAVTHISKNFLLFFGELSSPVYFRQRGPFGVFRDTGSSPEGLIVLADRPSLERALPACFLPVVAECWSQMIGVVLSGWAAPRRDGRPLAVSSELDTVFEVRGKRQDKRCLQSSSSSSSKPLSPTHASLPSFLDSFQVRKGMPLHLVKWSLCFLSGQQYCSILCPSTSHTLVSRMGLALASGTLPRPHFSPRLASALRVSLGWNSKC